MVAATPYFLVDRDGFEGQERLNRHFWLTVRMPAAAKSTVYTTDVTVSGMGKTAVLPLTVRVVPVSLARPKQAIGLNYGPLSFPGWFEDTKAAGTFWAETEKDLRLMYDYGMTTVAAYFQLAADADFDAQDSRWAKFIELYRKTGFERELYMAGTMNYHNQMPRELGSPLDKAWQDAFVKYFRDHEKVAQRYRQKVIYSIGDETTNDGGEARIIQVGRLAKERMDDLALISDINGYRELMGLAPFLDACGFNNGWAGSYGTNRREQHLMTRDVIERVRALGASPWFINGGKGRYPFGIWFWKTTGWGVDGKIEWHYNAATADLYNPFDGTSRNDFGSLVLPEQVCTVEIELCREGIDDLRYLQRLDALIAKHAGASDPFLRGVRGRAAFARDFWHDCVPDGFTSVETADGSGRAAGQAWPASRLNRMRREAAMLICMFEGAPVAGVYDEMALVDGDTGENPERQLGGSVTTRVKDAEHATQGEYCFKLMFKDGKGYADQWGRPPEKDWRGYRFLRLDVVNPQPRPVKLNLILRDQLAANLGDQKLAHRAEWTCAPGKNAFEIPLVGLRASGADRELDLGCLFSFFFTTSEATDTTVYVDHMRLCPK